MSGAKECICKGKPLNVLIAAFAGRARGEVAEGVIGGRPMAFKQLQLTALLVKKLSDGDSKMPFDARYRLFDHHLATCPCSPRYAPKVDESQL